MPTENWDDYMIEKFRADPSYVPGFLNACLEESEGAFLSGLKLVVQARFGGATGLSRRIEMHRVTIHNMLSGKRDPRLSNVGKIVEALGLRLQVGIISEPAGRGSAGILREPTDRGSAGTISEPTATESRPVGSKTAQ